MQPLARARADFDRIRDPGDVDRIRHSLAESDPAGRLAPVGLRQVVIGDGALSRVPALVSELLGQVGVAADRTPTVALVVDETEIRAGALVIKDEVQRSLAGRFEVRRVVLAADHPPLHVTPEVVTTASTACAGVDCIVSVGGGSISDIGKLAARRDGTAVHVAVQTAASVDGYTDNVSVILRDGVKRTVPSRWPDAVVADLDVVASAPAAMNQGGYGEVLSMFTAPADWYLAAVVGLDDSFHWGPIDLLHSFGRDINTWSAGLAQLKPSSVDRLTAMLAVRGIATGVAGSTACLSGVEHLISHMLDMHHGALGLPVGSHGAQVGVGSVVAAAAWELLAERLGAEVPQLSADDIDVDEERLRDAFSPIDPTGRLGAECWSDYSSKQRRLQASIGELNTLLSAWSDHAEVLGELVAPSRRLGAGLRASGGACRFADLDPSIDVGLAAWAVGNCHLMRSRLTVVDLLDALGWWQPENVDEVLDRAAAAVSTASAGAVTP